jgi:hypothetical protein
MPDDLTFNVNNVRSINIHVWLFASISLNALCAVLVATLVRLRLRLTYRPSME